MAEAAVDTRYYCHQCLAEIHPTLPEFTCPDCENGFIEEIENLPESSANNGRQTSSSSTSLPDLTPPAPDIGEWAQSFLETLQSNIHRQNLIGDTGFPPLSRRRLMVRQGSGNRNPMLDLMSQIVGGIRNGGGFPENGVPNFGFFNTHGMDPGDFVWGPGGIDIIVTQLLNQMEGTGAPPADKSIIDSLPTVQITQADVDKTLQCSVCMDNYKLDEEVRLLPCQHKYHTDCIVPWLQIHGTCPVCRKDLNGDLPNKDHSDVETNESNPDDVDIC